MTNFLFTADTFPLFSKRPLCYAIFWICDENIYSTNGNNFLVITRNHTIEIICANYQLFYFTKYKGLFTCPRNNLVFLLLHVLTICGQMTHLFYVKIFFCLIFIKYIFVPTCRHFISIN